MLAINFIRPFDFSINDMTHKSNSKESMPQEYSLNVEGVGKVKGYMKDDIGVTIFDIQETKIIKNPSYSDKIAQGKYVIISFAISNGTKNTITINETLDEGLFTLIDGNGRKYKYDKAANWSIEGEYKPDINLGLTVGKRIAYDVPENIDLNSMKFKVNMGLFGANMNLPLKVQLVQ